MRCVVSKVSIQFHILCEGKSENIYIKELNKLFEDNEIPIYFTAININGSSIQSIKNCYELANEKNSTIKKLSGLTEIRGKEIIKYIKKNKI